MITAGLDPWRPSPGQRPPSAFWILPRSSLPGPEEASPFHNITGRKTLTVMATRFAQGFMI